MARPGGPVTRLRGVDGVVVDRIVGAAVVAAIELQLWLGSSTEGLVFTTVVGVALGTAVAVRRRFPLAAAAVVPVFMGVKMALEWHGSANSNPGVIVGVLLVFYGLGAYADERRSVWMLGFAAVVTTVNSLTKPGGGVGGAVVMEVAGVFAPYALGRLMRAAAKRERAQQDAAERLDASREAEGQAAAADERLRIARELHDVITHTLSVMVIQAGGARLLLDEDPLRASDALCTVEVAGREALAEMRRLVGMLGEADAAERAPQPTLADVEALLGRARALGVSAEYRVDGDPVPVPPALDLCAYRVVQEALTNVIRHAAPARASVEVHWSPRVLELVVADDGRRGVSRRVGGGGHGLVGMRERVAMHRGTFEAGARPEGGYLVRARLPLADGALG